MRKTISVESESREVPGASSWAHLILVYTEVAGLMKIKETKGKKEKVVEMDGEEVGWLYLQSPCRVTPLAVNELGLFLQAGDWPQGVELSSPRCLCDFIMVKAFSHESV